MATTTRSRHGAGADRAPDPRVRETPTIAVHEDLPPVAGSMPRRDAVVVDRRTLLRIIGGTSLATVGSWAFTSAVATAQSKPKRIGVGQPARTADFYQGFINAVEERAKQLGYEILQSFSGNAPEKQLAELNTWIEAGVDALVVLPRDRNAIGRVVQKCKEKGIVFVGYANAIPGEDGHIKWDDPGGGAAIGGVAAKFIRENLGGQAEVALLTFVNNQATRERIENARAALQKEAPQVALWQAEALLAPDALKVTQSLLQAHPGIKVIVCCTDDGALGARSAFMNSGQPTDNVFICGFDGSKQNLKLIQAKDKFIRASAALDLVAVGHYVIDIPHNIFNKRQPVFVEMPYTIVTHATDDGTINRLLKVYGNV